MTADRTSSSEAMRPLRKLDLVEDMPFQRKNWWIQRVGWALFLLLLALAVLGLFGEGVLSDARRESGGLRIEYSRFARRGMPTRILIEVGGAESRPRLSLSRSFASRLRGEPLIPAPALSTTTTDGLVLDFERQPAGSSLWVQFEITHGEAGICDGWIRLADEPPVQIRQWVYP